MNNKNFDFLEQLNLISNILQVANYEENLKQSSNDQIMKSLDEQTEKYLKLIINQNNQIIELLKGLKK